MANEEIASVNSIGHVRGVAIGNVTVTGLVQAVDAETGKLVVVSQDQVEVEVVQLRAIRIQAPITRMKTGTQMPVYVIGLTSSQTPFSFGNALPGLTFHWTTTKRDTLELQSRHAEASVQLQPEHDFAMSVAGKTKGRTGLKVVLKVTDTQAGQLEGNLLELIDELQIQVYDKLHMLNPAVEAEEILMAPNSGLKLQTSRDGVCSLSYRVLDCPNQATIVQVDEKGLLSSGSLTGSSSLLVTSQETFGVNQTLVLAVKVAPVSYLRFSTSPILHRDSLSAIPLGMVLTFTGHLHANTGEVLHSHNSLLTFTTNRDDLVQVGRGPGNNSLTVRTVNVGLTLLAVWDEENTGMADYLALPVQHAIHPEDATMLVVGDVVCLSAQHFSPQGVPGTWSSSSTGVLQVDSKTGVTVARDAGTATVYYEIPGLLKTYREVVVEGATRTAVMAHSAAVRGDKDTRVLLTTRENGNNLIGSCSSAQTASIALLHPESSVSCLLSFTSDSVEFSTHDVYLTNTSFDPSTGFYSCSLTLQPLSDQQTRVLSLSMTSLLVRAGVKGSAFSGEQVCARLPVETGLYSDQTKLLLSNLQPNAELTVYGPAAALDSLKVSSSSLSISVQEREVSHGFPSFSKYMVSAMDPQAAASASVSITSSSTGHTLVIPVTLLHVADPNTIMQAAAPVVTMEGARFLQGFIDSYQMMFFTIFALLAGTAIIIIGFTSNSFVHKMTSLDPMSSPKPRLFSTDYYSQSRSL